MSSQQIVDLVNEEPSASTSVQLQRSGRLQNSPNVPQGRKGKQKVRVFNALEHAPYFEGSPMNAFIFSSSLEQRFVYKAYNQSLNLM